MIYTDNDTDEILILFIHLICILFNVTLYSEMEWTKNDKHIIGVTKG